MGSTGSGKGEKKNEPNIAVLTRFSYTTNPDGTVTRWKVRHNGAMRPSEAKTFPNKEAAIKDFLKKTENADRLSNDDKNSSWAIQWNGKTVSEVDDPEVRVYLNARNAKKFNNNTTFKSAKSRNKK